MTIKFLNRLGDQLLSVNELSLIDIKHSDAVDALRNAGIRVKLVNRYTHTHAN